MFTGRVLLLGRWGSLVPEPGDLWPQRGIIHNPYPPSNKRGSCSWDLMTRQNNPTLELTSTISLFYSKYLASPIGVHRKTQNFTSRKNKKAAQQRHWEMDFYIYSEQTRYARWMQLWLHYFLLTSFAEAFAINHSDSPITAINKALWRNTQCCHAWIRKVLSVKGLVCFQAGVPHAPPLLIKVLSSVPLWITFHRQNFLETDRTLLLNLFLFSTCYLFVLSNFLILLLPSFKTAGENNLYIW